uniref:Uncharacterized protein n=1 Tax=Octopus bimaculoides TaxID=37653 RepID=A0A0L8G4T1_OCTBM
MCCIRCRAEMYVCMYVCMYVYINVRVCMCKCGWGCIYLSLIFFSLAFRDLRLMNYLSNSNLIDQSIK